VGRAGHNIKEAEVREMIFSAPVEATIFCLPMSRYGQKFLIAQNVCFSQAQYPRDSMKTETPGML
jgi:hypothetical protein